MKFRHFFTGKPPDALEKDADAFFRLGEYGAAKLEYEKALLKSAKKASEGTLANDRLEEKIGQCKHALALEHKETAENLMEAGHYEEASDLLRLALELVQHEELAVEIEERLRSIENPSLPSETSETSKPDGVFKDADEFVYQESVEDYFTALVSTLPKTEQEVYTRYGDPFKEGYVKLNQGDFENAVTLLSQALKENPSAGSFIRLELATALLNSGNDLDARFLLEGFLKDHPESLRAYPLLCEIYWQNELFNEARRLLLNCPPQMRDASTIQLLIGETLFQAGRYGEAETHYRDYLQSHGWDEGIALALAKTFELLGSKDKARGLYAEIMNACQGCGRTIDPFIKQRYADTSLETGDHSTKVLELYLGLVQEVPENRTDYYQKISMIYTLNGNEKEADRFRGFAEQSQNAN
ncbi:MAG: tetratricopeptide repeat protein [Desulfobacteraceae bacterium]|nr:tetratricopeptide repeat protein [Desulfobacteraceae bacterium]